MSVDHIVHAIQDKASLLRSVAEELDNAAEQLHETSDWDIPCNVVARLSSLMSELELGRFTSSMMAEQRGMNHVLNLQNKKLKEVSVAAQDPTAAKVVPYAGSPITATQSEDIGKLKPEMWQTLGGLYLRLVERETARREAASRPSSESSYEWPHSEAVAKAAARSAERRSTEDGLREVSPTSVAPSETSDAASTANKPWDFLKEAAKSEGSRDAAQAPNGPWDSLNDTMLTEDALEARLEAAHEENEQEYRRSLEIEIEAAIEDAAEAEYDERDGDYAKDAEALMSGDTGEDFDSELPPLGYDHKFGDNRDCECGHHYDRHFDLTAPYPEAQEASCKYCSCTKFVEAGGPPHAEGDA